jgi:hypothetical protein
MPIIRLLAISALLPLGLCSLQSCAGVVATDKLPPSVWAQLVAGYSQELIIEFADSASKKNALLNLSRNEIELLKDYETLPLVFLRFHSAAALRDFLLMPSVVNAYEDRQEHLLFQKAKP